jgi:hypothetical protein
MKIIKTCVDTYYVLDGKDRAMTDFSLSLRELVLQVCLIKNYLDRRWKPTMGVPFEVLFEFDVIEEVRKAYPEFLL